MNIQEVAFSAIWAETNFHLMVDPLSSDAPFRRLGRKWEYEPVFEKIKSTGKAVSGLALPWNSPTGQMFWTRYLEKAPGEVTGAQAWKALVPLRRSPAVSLKAEWFPGRI